jgi:hypothetical protein
MLSFNFSIFEVFYTFRTSWVYPQEDRCKCSFVRFVYVPWYKQYIRGKGVFLDRSVEHTLPPERLLTPMHVNK